MKKFIAVLVAAMALLSFSGMAWALTAAHTAAGGPDGGTGATQGDCSACHIPHKAQGAERLFPTAVGAGTRATLGFMGTMCAEYCHGAGKLAQANATQNALFNVGGGANGMAAGSHGVVLAAGRTKPTQTTVPATLPYGNGVNGVNASGDPGMECTTCHNPHKNATLPAVDTSNALLQLDIDAICDECHAGRGLGDTAWSGYGYDPANVTGNTLGAHPVGPNVFGDNSQHDYNGVAGLDPDSDIDIGIGVAAGSSEFDAIYGNSGLHNLGGHLINGATVAAAGNGVGCVTCHAVHGRQTDGGAATNPFEDLLAIQQGAGGAAEPTYSANGTGSVNNALCAGCHAFGAVAGNSWNPGHTAFSHPCDDNGGVAATNMGVVTNPGWPVGSTPGTNMDFAVICETCHDPHEATANTHMLRAAETALCGTCHTATPTGHHPVGAGLMGAVNGGRFADAAIGDGDANLTCADCHNGNGAHNWLAAGAIGLDPDWQPFNNGRGTESAANRFVPLTSKECYDCHTNSGAHNSPTDGVNNTTHGGLIAGADNAAMTYRGEASHIIGTTASTAYASGELSTGAFDALTQLWNAQGGYSRFGGANLAAHEVACESCHELELDKKDNTNNAMLLLNYNEDEDLAAAGAQNWLCTGCHGRHVGAGSHPVSGDAITKAVDLNRAQGTGLLAPNTAAGTYADRAPTFAEYPATGNRMSCDSCHQPHKAFTNTSTFVLETAMGNNAADVGNTTFAGLAGQPNADSGDGKDHAPLCADCHNY